MNTLLERLRAAVPHCASGNEIEARYLGDTQYALAGAPPLAVVRPLDVNQVAAVLRLCNEAGVPVVPQGGRTGLAGGAVPLSGCVVLSMELMRGVIEVDAAAATLTAWAGTTLQEVQEAAAAAGMFYPVDLGGRGTCQIGGNVGTNAGGNRVLRYGMTRQQVLGLEAVLADGTVVSSLNKMLKNNTGYDLKQLFVGSEGTLGVVTRVVLRLQPQPLSTCTALVAVADYDAVLGLLQRLRAQLGGTLSAFEMMWPDFYEFATNLPTRTRPLALGHGAYVLVEALGSDQARDQERFDAVLGAALEDGLAQDAVVAQSAAQTTALWTVRDSSSELRRAFWPHVGYDVSVPTGEIGRFIEACGTALRARWPQVRTVFFGHVGDANIHIGIQVGDGEQPEHDFDEVVYGLVRSWQGSVSAEHGIGLQKRAWLGHSRNPAELALMRTIKHALDPRGILNPDKIFG
jgi:FAD/FMN-containing dehydrogenase